MKNTLLRWELAGVLFVILFGSILHFTYEWSGKNIIVGAFSAVNESTWEHLKLLYFPFLVFSIIEYFFIGKQYNCFLQAKAISSIIGLIMIVVIFYTYTGIIGDNIIWMDILTFLIAVVIAFIVSYKLITSERCDDLAMRIDNTAAIGIFLFIAALFVLFTFYPPNIALFQDPITKSYGIQATNI